MKHNRFVWKIIVFSVIMLVLIAGSVMIHRAMQERMLNEKEDVNILSLEIPSFVPTVSAGGSNGNEETGSYLEEEAGISAYTNVGEEIDLEKAKSVYRTVEYETDEYIIGSVELPGYPETEDVHIYVHQDGWIVVYYLKDEPVAKIIDWLDYQGAQITSTKLEDGIVKMCNEVGVPLVETRYYDFRTPSANRLVIVADAQWNEGTDSFEIKIPVNFIVYRRSWSHHSYDSWGSSLILDGNTISSLGNCDNYWRTDYGMLSPMQLKSDVFHTVSLWHDENCCNWYGEAFGAIVLVYQEA